MELERSLRNVFGAFKQAIHSLFDEGLTTTRARAIRLKQCSRRRYRHCAVSMSAIEKRLETALAKVRAFDQRRKEIDG